VLGRADVGEAVLTGAGLAIDATRGGLSADLAPKLREPVRRRARAYTAAHGPLDRDGPTRVDGREPSEVQLGRRSASAMTRVACAGPRDPRRFGGWPRAASPTNCARGSRCATRSGNELTGRGSRWLRPIVAPAQPRHGRAADHATREQHVGDPRGHHRASPRFICLGLSFQQDEMAARQPQDRAWSSPPASPGPRRIGFTVAGADLLLSTTAARGRRSNPREGAVAPRAAALLVEAVQVACRGSSA